MANETYLGDGLWASFDGFNFSLRAPREGGDHWVALEPEVLVAFLAYAEAQKRKWMGEHGHTR